MNTPKLCPLFVAAQMTPTTEGDETQAHQYTTHENAAKWAGCLGSRCGGKWTTEARLVVKGIDNGGNIMQAVQVPIDGYGRCADGGDFMPDPAAGGGQ